MEQRHREDRRRHRMHGEPDPSSDRTRQGSAADHEHHPVEGDGSQGDPGRSVLRVPRNEDPDPPHARVPIESQRSHVTEQQYATVHAARVTCARSSDSGEGLRSAALHGCRNQTPRATSALTAT